MRESSFAYPSKAQFYSLACSTDPGSQEGGMSVDIDPCEHRDRQGAVQRVGQGGGKSVVSRLISSCNALGE